MKKIAAILVLFSLCTVAFAGTPLVLSLIDPIQYPKHDCDQAGLRLGIYSRVHDNKGLTLGLINMADGETCALELGGSHILKGDATGVVAGWVFVAKSNYTGFYLGALGRVRETMQGMNVSLISANKKVVGLQAGGINISKDVRGLQLGLINVTEDMYGVQIGILNIITKGNIPVLPIFNAKF